MRISKRLISSLINGIFFSIMLCSPLFAQSEDSTQVTLQDLKTPLSPAFVLLGMEPSSIERPTTPKAVSVSLYSAFSSSDLIPDSYAMEFAPYWLKSRPTLTFEDHFRDHSLAETFSRYLSVSMVTSKTTGLDSLSLNQTQMGLGFRTRLVEGEVDEDIKKRMQAKRIGIQLQQVTVLLALLIEDLDAATIAELKQKSLDLIQVIRESNDPVQVVNVPGATPKQIMESLETSVYVFKELFKDADSLFEPEEVDKVKEYLVRVTKDRKELKNLALELQSLSKERVGLIWEIAGAMSLAFPGNTFEEGNMNKYGLWSTITYRWKEPFVDAAFLTRIIREDRNALDEAWLLDLGAKLSYEVNEFTLSAEYISRSLIRGELDQNVNDNVVSGSFTVESSYRLAGELEYKIREGLYLQSTFGKDYDRMGGGGNLIATVGLDLGFGKPISLK